MEIVYINKLGNVSSMLTHSWTLSVGCAVHRVLVLILVQTFPEMPSTISNWNFQTGNVEYCRTSCRSRGRDNHEFHLMLLSSK